MSVTDMIYLSIVIPIRNEEKFIASTLTALAQQDYPLDRFELIVVNGMSSDNSILMVKKFVEEHPAINIVILENPGLLSSRARNIGIRAARGQLIGIIDGHVYIPNNRLFASMEYIATTNKALCLSRPAPLDVPGLEGGKAQWIAAARKSWLGHSRHSYIYNNYDGFVDPISSGFAYDKSVFTRIGYFDESFDAAEDVEFNFRLKEAGIYGYSSADLTIYSYPRETFSSLFRQQTRYGTGRVRFVRKHSSGLTKETFIPVIIFLLFILYPLVIIAGRHFALLAELHTSAILLYCSIVLIIGVREALKQNVILPGFFISWGIWTTHMGLGWGMLKTFFAKPESK